MTADDRQQMRVMRIRPLTKDAECRSVVYLDASAYTTVRESAGLVGFSNCHFSFGTLAFGGGDDPVFTPSPPPEGDPVP